MSQIPSEYVIPEGIYNPNSQNISESLIATSLEMSVEGAAFRSQTRESQIALARREMGEKAVFGSRPETVTPISDRLYFIAGSLQKARLERLRISNDR